VRVTLAGSAIFVKVNENENDANENWITQKYAPELNIKAA